MKFFFDHLEHLSSRQFPAPILAVTPFYRCSLCCELEGAGLGDKVYLALCL